MKLVDKNENVNIRGDAMQCIRKINENKQNTNTVMVVKMVQSAKLRYIKMPEKMKKLRNDAILRTEQAHSDSKNDGVRICTKGVWNSDRCIRISRVSHSRIIYLNTCTSFFNTQIQARGVEIVPRLL